MALKKSIETNFGLTVENSYIRVEGMRIVEKSGRKYCIPKDGGQWLEFAGKKEDINWL